MKRPEDLDWYALERLYDEGRALFLRGKYEDAIEKLNRVFEDTVDLREVREIVVDYYAFGQDEWVTKYKAFFACAA